MDLLPTLLVLCRKWKVVLLGLPLMLAAFVLAQGASGDGQRATDVASERVLIDTPQSQVGDVSPPGGDAMLIRASLLTAAMAADRSVRRIASGARLSANAIEFEAFATGPALATPLARSVAEMNAAPRRPYAVEVTSDPGLPIITVRASAPDRRGADALAQAAVETLRGLAAPQGVQTKRGYSVTSLGPVATRATAAKTTAILPYLTLLVFPAWCLLVLFATGASRAWRRAGLTVSPG
jgi:hypothetical protein